MRACARSGPVLVMSVTAAMAPAVTMMPVAAAIAAPGASGRAVMLF